jgi:hypothetical protein
LHARLIHHWIETTKPLIEEVLRQEFLEHVSVNLFLILRLGRVIPVQIVSIEDLHNLLTIEGPMLERANTDLPFSLGEVLLNQEVTIFIFYFKVDFTWFQVVNIVIIFSPILSLGRVICP